jgi:hypothetical protein
MNANRENLSRIATSTRVERDLKLLLRTAGVNSRDAARAIGDAPSTLRGRLNGDLPLSIDRRARIVRLCSSRLAERKAIAKEATA